jgi:hypothetical protein
MAVPSMVIDNFHVHGALRRPHKTNAKLIVDPYAVLAGAIPSQRFETVSRRHSQIIEGIGPFQLLELATRDRLDVPKSLDRLALEKPSRVRTLKGLDGHGKGW